ncbi:uncharacterized protein RCC_06133 [Ramularia collo-cygni]|uniref:Myb-like domain-containing protein n=1 Tax=Ramularia collo-cygni TaxID=112498 RepID=A0A2D3V0N2_9PEZI|nr:uncharacterized protein RCC_06133 [Ramularia collo-cygni]CZT20275.1 uncharacterized protein RCC_06133 [Ramularia collo-cygni]
MSALNLTAREIELLCGVLEVMKASIDWVEVAGIANFTKAKQARDKWPALRNKVVACNVKKREGKSEGGGDDVPVDSSAAPKKAAPKKRKAAGESAPAKAKKTKKTAVTQEKDTDEVRVKPELSDGDDQDLIS